MPVTPLSSAYHVELVPPVGATELHRRVETSYAIPADRGRGIISEDVIYFGF